MKLIEEVLTYRTEDLFRWIEGDFSLINSTLPSHIADLIKNKKGNRKIGSRRFFSEVCLLNHYAPYIKDQIVWYSSYKWLSKHCWYTGRVKGELKNQFYSDLMKFIGKDNIYELQQRALTFRQFDGGRILGRTKSGKVKYPVAPDIWLMLRDGTLTFIEGKHKEKIESTQLVGLAILKKTLNCNISITRVCPDDLTLIIPKDYSNEFSSISRIV